ncbi:MAG: 3-deoxy-manno-octulosonate cytidylyltransferase [Planctomycetota bacterium]
MPVAIIPARLASTRFPRKVLADQTGMPMIQHVALQAIRARHVERVVVATDASEVVESLAPYATACTLTDPEHPNGTARLAEAAEKLSLADSEIVINIQGDEPELEPECIDAAVEALLADPGAPMSTVISPFGTHEDPTNPNIVKCVRSVTGRAMYFSRSLIPHDRDGGADITVYKHIGLYVYRVAFLRMYAALAPTPLEQAEKLEQLRALENGHTIATAVFHTNVAGIDTQEDYEAFVSRWKEQHSSANP